MKVLIVRLSALGDVIHGLPVAARLKEAIPGVELTWLVEEPFVDLLDGNPAVDRAIVFPKSRWKKELRSVLGLPGLPGRILDFARHLQSFGFTAAIDLQGLLKSALPAVASGAKSRFGFSTGREGSNLFLTDKLDIGDYFSSDRHVVELNLALCDFFLDKLRAAGLLSDKIGADAGGGTPAHTAGETALSTEQPQLMLEHHSYIYTKGIDRGARFPLPAPRAEAHQRVERYIDGNSHGAPCIVLIPGTTWSSKIWPVEHWAALANLLGKAYGCRIIIVGGRAEQESNAKLASSVSAGSVDNLTGLTSLQDLIALFERVDLVIGGDTGPLHLAAAVGRAAVLAIFGSTPAGRNGPYGSKCATISRALECQPCFSKVCPLGTTACLTELSPDIVFEAARHTLAIYR